MLELPAWHVLSLTARRAFDRIEIEHMAHAGKDNGRLPVTYADFERAGIHTRLIAGALRELEALGFIETMKRRYRGAGGTPRPVSIALLLGRRGTPRGATTAPTNISQSSPLNKLRRLPLRRAPMPTRPMWNGPKFILPPALSAKFRLHKVQSEAKIPDCTKCRYRVTCTKCSTSLYLGRASQHSATRLQRRPPRRLRLLCRPPMNRDRSVTGSSCRPTPLPPPPSLRWKGLLPSSFPANLNLEPPNERECKGFNCRIADIEIPATARPYNAGEVVKLSESISKIGLQSAPTIIEREGRYRLVAGRHRLEALKLLGHETVLARLVDFDDIEARLWSISENLHRAELTVSQRAEQVSEYSQLVKERREGDRLAQVGPHPSNTKGDSGREGGDRLAARDLGITRQEVRAPKR